MTLFFLMGSSPCDALKMSDFKDVILPNFACVNVALFTFLNMFFVCLSLCYFHVTAQQVALTFEVFEAFLAMTLLSSRYHCVICF